MADDLQLLSQRLTGPLSKIVEGHLLSSVGDIVAEFKISEKDLVRVIVNGRRRVKPAPARRASPKEPAISPPANAPPPSQNEPPANTLAPAQSEPPASPPESQQCNHYIRGKTPHRCPKQGKHSVDGRWLCLRHKTTKSTAKSSVARPSNLAHKVLAEKKKLLSKAPAIEIVEENGRYFDKATLICFDPKDGNLAIGALNADDRRTLDRLSDPQIELLTTQNLKYRQPQRDDPDHESSADDNSQELTLLSDSEYRSETDSAPDDN
uniref:Uncharacterized protein n=1 Tax=Marseillevirus LCMAC103 TaxID=2506604 RepID=A0A481YUI3_9VIRU|nr:MAG: uncharacterized protein LCMAC103_02060 [Marseillevirus LCMAC103]